MTMSNNQRRVTRSLTSSFQLPMMREVCLDLESQAYKAFAEVEKEWEPSPHSGLLPRCDRKNPKGGRGLFFSAPTSITSSFNYLRLVVCADWKAFQIREGGDKHA